MSLKSDAEQLDIILLSFLIEKTKNAKSPLCLKKLAREFKEQSTSARSVDCLKMRIQKFSSKIHQIELIDTETKVKMLFAMSAPIDEQFLKELQKDAGVKINLDNEQRIVEYKKGNLELKGAHITSQITHKTNGNGDQDGQKNESPKENLIKYITARCENVQSPLSIRQLAKDYQSDSGATENMGCLSERVKKYRSEICKVNDMELDRKVKQLFGLSVRVDADCLEGLRTTAQVEVDEQNRIVKYQSDTLNLQGDHSLSAKTKAAMVTWRSRRSAKDADKVDGDEAGKTGGETLTDKNGGKASKRKNTEEAELVDKAGDDKINNGKKAKLSKHKNSKKEPKGGAKLSKKEKKSYPPLPDDQKNAPEPSTSDGDRDARAARRESRRGDTES